MEEFAIAAIVHAHVVVGCAIVEAARIAPFDAAAMFVVAALRFAWHASFSSAGLSGDASARIECIA
jgi:hypothetical protein